MSFATSACRWLFRDSHPPNLLREVTSLGEGETRASVTCTAGIGGSGVFTQDSGNS